MLFLAHQVGMGVGSAGIALTSLDTDGVLQSVLTTLRDNTATIATSLTTATNINLVKDGDPQVAVPITIDKYPAIIVKLVRELEDFSQVGGSGSKHLYELEFEIYPMIYQDLGVVESDQDIRIMTKNICQILKANITLSGTALGSLPENIDYFPVDLDGIYLSAAQINFRSHHLNL